MDLKYASYATATGRLNIRYFDEPGGQQPNSRCYTSARSKVLAASRSTASFQGSITSLSLKLPCREAQDLLSKHGRELLIEYRPSDDSLYVNINDSGASVSSTKSIDSRREVDYAEDGSVIAVHFLRTSLGIELDGVPERHAVERALRRLRMVLQQLDATSPKGPPRSGRIGTPLRDP